MSHSADLQMPDDWDETVEEMVKEKQRDSLSHSHHRQHSFHEQHRNSNSESRFAAGTDVLPGVPEDKRVGNKGETHKGHVGPLRGVIVLRVAAARGLRNPNMLLRPDCYCTVTYKDQEPFTTTVARPGTDAKWEGEMNIVVDTAVAADELLTFKIFDEDIGPDDFMATLELSVAQVLETGSGEPRWYKLVDPNDFLVAAGEILLTAVWSAELSNEQFEDGKVIAPFYTAVDNEDVTEGRALDYSRHSSQSVLVAPVYVQDMVGKAEVERRLKYYNRFKNVPKRFSWMAPLVMLWGLVVVITVPLNQEIEDNGSADRSYLVAGFMGFGMFLVGVLCRYAIRASNLVIEHEWVDGEYHDHLPGIEPFLPLGYTTFCMMLVFMGVASTLGVEGAFVCMAACAIAAIILSHVTFLIIVIVSPRPFLRWLLVAINVVFYALSLVLVFVAVYARRKTELEQDLGAFPDWVFYAAVGVAGVIVIVSCFGIVASKAQSKAGLRWYTRLMVLVLLIAAGIAVATLIDHVPLEDVVQRNCADIVYSVSLEDWDDGFSCNKYTQAGVEVDCPDKELTRDIWEGFFVNTTKPDIVNKTAANGDPLYDKRATLLGCVNLECCEPIILWIQQDLVYMEILGFLMLVCAIIAAVASHYNHDLLRNHNEKFLHKKKAEWVALLLIILATVIVAITLPLSVDSLEGTERVVGPPSAVKRADNYVGEYLYHGGCGNVTALPIREYCQDNGKCFVTVNVTCSMASVELDWDILDNANDVTVEKHALWATLDGEWEFVTLLLNNSRICPWCLNGNPGFVDVALDYVLRSDSPAKRYKVNHTINLVPHYRVQKLEGLVIKAENSTEITPIENATIYLDYVSYASLELTANESLFVNATGNFSNLVLLLPPPAAVELQQGELSDHVMCLGERQILTTNQNGTFETTALVPTDGGRYGVQLAFSHPAYYDGFQVLQIGGLGYSFNATRFAMTQTMSPIVADSPDDETKFTLCEDGTYCDPHSTYCVQLVKDEAVCGPCEDGYEGNGVDSCTWVNPCLTNNGDCDALVSCSNVVGTGAACGNCPSGYSGTGADGCWDIDECTDPAVCPDDRRTCVNVPGGFYCEECPLGFLQENDGTCTDNTTACNFHACLNNGTCTDDNDYFDPFAYTCNCSLAIGFNGDRCQDKTNICNDFDPCQNGGSCVYDSSAHDVSCDCDNTGYQGQHCQKPVDDCVSSPCENGGVCLDLHQDYFCNCSYTGLYGRQCTETFIDCATTDPCVNGGVCHEDGTCDCSGTGFIGTICDVGVCTSSPCYNGGVCSAAAPLNYTCSGCDAGYQGRRCQNKINPCQSNPCYNGGICYNDTSSLNFTCNCATGYAGSLCQLDADECASAPCNNGGTCVDTGFLSFTCECEGTGYNGTRCNDNMNDCRSNPCQNGAPCSDGLGANYTCDCSGLDYQGLNCHELIDYCASNPCKHGSTCSNEPGSYSCACTAFWEGVNCNDDVNECGIDHGGCSPVVNCNNVNGELPTCDACPKGYEDIYNDGTECREKTNEAGIRGIVFNALTNVGVPASASIQEVEIFAGLYDSRAVLPPVDDAAYKASINQYGYFFVSGVIPGEYTITCSQCVGPYHWNYAIVSVVASLNVTVNLGAVPFLTVDNSYRVVLEWPTGGRDLDLEAEYDTGDEICKCGFYKKECGECASSLDASHGNGWGPEKDNGNHGHGKPDEDDDEKKNKNDAFAEVITISELEDTVYNFFVSAYHTSHHQAFAGSRATVKLFAGLVLDPVQIWAVPAEQPHDAKYWDVFCVGGALDNVAAVNVMQKFKPEIGCGGALEGIAADYTGEKDENNNGKGGGKNK